jgi:hypothetical protein
MYRNIESTSENVPKSTGKLFWISVDSIFRMKIKLASMLTFLNGNQRDLRILFSLSVQVTLIVYIFATIQDMNEYDKEMS